MKKILITIICLLPMIASGQGISLSTYNPIISTNGFLNTIEFKNLPHAAIVFNPAAANEIMFGFHSNGNYYWGTGRSSSRPDFYSMTLNAFNGDLQIQGRFIANQLTVSNAASFNSDLEIAGKLRMGGQSVPRWGSSISSYVVESSHYYGHNATENIWIGEEFNPVVVRGNVGIGSSTTPWTRLMVSGSAGNSDAAGIVRIGVDGLGTNLRLGIHNAYSWIQSHGGMPLRINELGNNTYLNSFGGNVGIGTATDQPGYRLIVNGKVMAEEMKVVVDVPADYVFDNEYKIRSLHEVEEYIQQHHHLPGVPSADDIKENGWHVGQMANKLLEKVEELTLYMIEIKKENELLKRELLELKRQSKSN